MLLFLQMTAEFLIVVSTPSSNNAPPTIVGPHEVIYVSPGSSLTRPLTITDPDTIMGVQLHPLPPQPQGVRLEGPTVRGPNTAEASIHWQPSSTQLGTHMLCFLASDHYSTRSPPTCLIVVVTREFEEVS